MSNQEGKVKGIADIVFLIDVTASMGPCIDGLKRNIKAFIQTLVENGENGSCLKDWRIRVVGYRDYTRDGSNWFEDNPFTRNPEEVYSQIERLRASGGGPEPEDLLDALYLIGNAGNPNGMPEEDFKWRGRSEAVRFIVVFTDASFHPEVHIEGAVGAGVEDIITLIMNNKLRISLFAPSCDCYSILSEADKLEWNDYMAETNERHPQAALEEYTSNAVNFQETMVQLAKTLTQTANTEAL